MSNPFGTIADDFQPADRHPTKPRRVLRRISDNLGSMQGREPHIQGFINWADQQQGVHLKFRSGAGQWMQGM